MSGAFYGRIVHRDGLLLLGYADYYAVGVVVGRADKNSKIWNVFNLSPKLNSLKGSPLDNGPARYRLSSEDGKV